MVHVERNHLPYGLSFHRLMQEGAAIASPEPPTATTLLTSPSSVARQWSPVHGSLLVNGMVVVWHACHEPTMLLSEPLARLVRKPGHL